MRFCRISYCKLFYSILFVFYSYQSVAQSRTILNAKGKWFYGVEVGLNTITSLKPTTTHSVQAGVIAEYFFTKEWAASGRIKYFKSGIPIKYNSKNVFFDGAVIAMPLNIKWEFTISNKFNGNFKIGFALNQEVKSKYFYPQNENTNFSKFYPNFNSGLGISDMIANNTSIYLYYELAVLGNMRDDADFLQIVPNSPNNNLFNAGIKFKLKKMNSVFFQKFYTIQKVQSNDAL